MADRAFAFADKYDATHALYYFQKHQRGFWRRLNTWWEIGMARRALKLAGNPQSVLDLPCGTGRFWAMLAERRDRTIYAADLNCTMFRTGLELRPREITSRIEVFQAYADSIPKADGFVECVLCLRLFHHLPKREERLAILREFKRVTSSTIIISLWVEGNYRAWRQRGKEQRRKGERKKDRDRFLISRATIEEEFRECGLRVVGRVDFLKFYSMWAAYVVEK